MRTTRGRVVLLVILVVLGVLAACAAPAESPRPAPATPCLPEAPAGECVGLSDGSFNLASDPQFDAVFAAISQENARVGALGKTVSIVYALPLPRVPNGLSRQWREELEGAYLLQRRANDERSDITGLPYVQVLVANLGENADGWRPVVARVTQMLDPRQQGNVVGVAGFSQSLAPVRDALAALAEAQVPMVPTRLTADGISPAPGSDGVFSIAQPVSAQVRAAASFLSTSCSPVLVRDVRRNDLYVDDLAANFPVLTAAAQARSTSCPAAPASPLAAAGEPLALARFDSSLPGVANVLQQRIPDICQRNPDTVYWGGRATYLPAFVAALGSRDRTRCPGPITVVTASDGLLLANEIATQNAAGGDLSLGNALRNGIRVVVTGLAHPGQWGPAPDATDPRLSTLLGTCNRCLRSVFPQETLDDGVMIMAHDAVLTLVRAARAGVDQQTLGEVSNLTVRQSLVGFGVGRPVAGAAGDIGFDDVGKPLGKPVPVVVLDERGGITYQQSL